MRTEQGIRERREYHCNRRATLKAQGRCRECRVKCEKSLCAECMGDKVRRRKANESVAQPESRVERMMRLAERLRYENLFQ